MHRRGDAGDNDRQMRIDTDKSRRLGRTKNCHAVPVGRAVPRIQKNILSCCHEKRKNCRAIPKKKNLWCCPGRKFLSFSVGVFTLSITGGPQNRPHPPPNAAGGWDGSDGGEVLRAEPWRHALENLTDTTMTCRTYAYIWNFAICKKGADGEDDLSAYSGL